MDPDLDQVKTPSSLSMPPTLTRTNSAVFNGLLLATAASVKPSAAAKLQDGLDLSPGPDYVYNKHQKQEDITMRMEDEENLEPPPITLYLGYERYITRIEYQITTLL